METPIFIIMKYILVGFQEQNRHSKKKGNNKKSNTLDRGTPITLNEEVLSCDQ